MPPADHASHASYVRSGFAHRIGWGSRPALLLIDVCKAYWNEASPLDTSSNPAAMAVPESIGRLVVAAREGQVPLVGTRVEYSEPDMADAGIFVLKAPLLTTFRKGNMSGLDGWVTGLESHDGEIIVSKKYPSAFLATDLTTRLQLRNVDTLVICGVSTSGCVRASTLDAMCYGFRPMVVSETSGDRSPEIHNANIFDLDATYADVVPEQEAIEKLRAWGGSNRERQI